MKYIVIIICVVVIAIIFVTVLLRKKKEHEAEVSNSGIIKSIETRNSLVHSNKASKIPIQIDMLPIGAISDESNLVEIKDNKVLSRINNLVPELLQVGNAANNVVQAGKSSGEVLYRAIIPAGTKLTESKAMNNAVRGIYHGRNGIKGHANWVAVEAQKGTSIVANTAAAVMGVASMVVGQYYMTQINTELGEIGDGVSKISEFQDNEYRSKVFSLIANVKKIAVFQSEILENNELRMSIIEQLGTSETQCTQLLGQADLTLAGYAQKKNQDYDAYEKTVQEAQNWFTYQKSLLEILYQISELEYTLYLGTVSRDQCTSTLSIYKNQISDTQDKLSAWHQENTERLNIDTDERRRKRKGIDYGLHYIPGCFNENLRFKTISDNTANMITEQVSGFENLYSQDTAELFNQDVQLISKNGRVYYYPQTALNDEAKP